MLRYEPLILRWKNLACLPVCHYSLEFAERVRLALRIDPPEAVALELPVHLAEAYVQAVRRLPQISILLCQDASGVTYLPVEPADPFSEAARWAVEHSVPLFLVDRQLDRPYSSHRDPVPDSYAILRVPPSAYYEAFRKLHEEKAPPDALDLLRERTMAFRLRQILDKFAKVAFVCGMAHARRVLQRLEEPQTLPLEPRRPAQVQIFHLHPECLDEVMSTIPFVSAVYELRRTALPPEPDRTRFTVRKQFRIRENPFSLVGRKDVTSDEKNALQASLVWTARRAGRSPEPPEDPGLTDRNLVLFHLFEESARHYAEETGESLRTWQRKIFWRFVRNYALLEGLLLPDFFHMLVGARSCVGDAFCHALLRLGGYYPWQEEPSKEPTLRVSGEDVWLGTRRLRIRRWFPRPKRRLRWIPLKRRKRENRPGEWIEAFDGTALCSYPPEDVVVEEYGRILRTRGLELLQDPSARIEPFSVSLEDGVDVRETLRRWSEKRIYVRTRTFRKGKAGAVVLIFDEDDEQNRFSYRMTWLGEHEQESDMAFYATPPEDHVVGPGICRCEYGGFLMIHPPRRLFDVWEDPDYRSFRRKSEVLLAAGIDYSLERQVIYVAPRPPRSYMRTLAERMLRQIVYLPLGSLSPSRLARIRVFHILSGYDKREIAKDYIW